MPTKHPELSALRRVSRVTSALLLGVMACHSRPVPPSSSPTPAYVAIINDAAVPAPALPTATALTPDAGGRPALRGSFESWTHAGFEIVASLPTGTREPRPIIVGIHGSGDRPEAACKRWRRTVAAWAFVVCPKGVPYRNRLAWGSPAGVAERIDAALASLRDRYRDYIAEGSVVYAGWSLGGTLGPKVVALRPDIFEPVILAELGHTRLDPKASMAALQTSKVSHVMIACATRRCATFAKRLSNVTFVDAGIGRGHVFDKPMALAIGNALADQVKSDPRWIGFREALATPWSDGDEPLPPDEEEPDLVGE